LQKSTMDWISVTPPVHKYYADPFIVYSEDDRCIVVFESYSRANRKGHINQALVDFKNKKVTQSPLIIEKCHLSYPFPFLLDNGLFISPESSQIGGQNIYRIERQGNVLKAKKTHFIKQRMVDAVFIAENPKADYKKIYFYTGTGNSDGLLVGAELQISNDPEIYIKNPKILGAYRPGGFVPGPIQPFQKINAEYGKGLCFLDISNEFKEVKSPNFFKSEILKSFNLIKTSHHLHQDSKYICFDTRIELSKSLQTTIVSGKS
jgi:hypothetical protein